MGFSTQSKPFTSRFSNQMTTQPSGGGEAPAEGASVVTQSGDLIDFEELALSGLMLLAHQPVHPWIKDYLGTVPEVDFSTASSLRAVDERGLMTGFSRVESNIGQYAALELTGAHRMRFMFDILDTPPSDVDIADYMGTGEAIDTDSIWNANIKGQELNSFREQAGADREVGWIIPGRWVTGEEYLADIRVAADDTATAFLNGLQLRRVGTAVGITNDGDGQVSGFITDGDGTNQVLCEEGLCIDPEVDLLYFHLFDSSDMDDESASAYASGKRVWRTDELDWLARDSFSSYASDPDILVAWEPVATGIQDSSGNGITLDITDTATSSKLIGDVYWTDSSGSGAWESSDVSLQQAGDLTLNVLFMAPGGSHSGFWVDQTEDPGTGSAANCLYRFGMNTTTNLRYFAEFDSGSNINCNWTIDTLLQYEIREYRLVREDDGMGNHLLRAYERKLGDTNWTQLTVASTTGTGAGTGEATVTKPTDGSNSTHTVQGKEGGNSGFVLREVAVFSAAKNPSPLA